MSQAMRKLAGTLSKFDTSAIFINQLREKIGVMFGSPETTPGGRALKFYSSVRLDVRKIENLKDGTDVVGSRTRVKVVKNKVAPPFRQCEFDIMYGKGISREGSLIDVGVDLEIIKKAGAWFTYEGEQLGQGRENARQFLAEHTDVRDEIERKIREAVGISEFGAEGEETPIEIIPDVVLDEQPAPASASEGATAPAPGPRRKPRSAQMGSDRCHPVIVVEGSPRTPRHAMNAPSGSWRFDHEAAGSSSVVCSPPPSIASEVDDVLARLERVGLVDDQAFARQMAEYQFGSRRAGRRAVTGALMEKGIAPDVIAQVVDDAPDDEEDRALALASTRAIRMTLGRAGQGVHPPHGSPGAPRV